MERFDFAGSRLRMTPLKEGTTVYDQEKTSSIQRPSNPPWPHATERSRFPWARRWPEEGRPVTPAVNSVNWRQVSAILAGGAALLGMAGTLAALAVPSILAAAEVRTKNIVEFSGRDFVRSAELALVMRQIESLGLQLNRIEDRLNVNDQNK